VPGLGSDVEYGADASALEPAVFSLVINLGAIFHFSFIVFTISD